MSMSISSTANQNRCGTSAGTGTIIVVPLFVYDCSSLDAVDTYVVFMYVCMYGHHI